MAKGGNIDPVEAESKSYIALEVSKKISALTSETGRRQRARELKKLKEQRQTQKLERIKNMNPQRLQRRIDELEQKKTKQGGHLGQEEKVLEGLRKDLALLKKTTGIQDSPPESPLPGLSQAEEETPEANLSLGKNSIFYDPEWNPFGRAPEGYTNYTLTNLPDPVSYAPDPEAVNIPLPTEEKPKFYKPLDTVKTIFEGSAIVKDRDVRSFMPTAVKRKIDQV